MSIRYIETKTSEYLQQLSDNDKADDDLDVSHIQAKIQRLKNAKIKYEALESQLNESIEPKRRWGYDHTNLRG